MRGKETVQKLGRTAVFCLVFCLLFGAVQRVLTQPGDMNRQLQATFAEDEPGTLDAVCIGGSNTFTLFQGPVAFAETGITVRCFGSDGQPLVAREYFLEQARKTQPDALYIITVQPYPAAFSEAVIHWSADAFPPSLTRLRMIHDLSAFYGVPLWDRVAYYLPLVQYHSRWSSLSTGDFHWGSNGLKGADNGQTFLETAEPQPQDLPRTQERCTLAQPLADYWEHLLDLCDEAGIEALFVVPPACTDEDTAREFNTVGDRIRARGYPVLDLLEQAEAVGLDPQTDYYNAQHTNVHGSLKATRFLADYLQDHYGFADKRGDPDFADWDQAAQQYRALLEPFLSDEERALLDG